MARTLDAYLCQAPVVLILTEGAPPVILREGARASSRCDATLTTSLALGPGPLLPLVPGVHSHRCSRTRRGGAGDQWRDAWRCIDA